MNILRWKRRPVSDAELVERVKGLPREIEPPADLWREIAPRLLDTSPSLIAPLAPSPRWAFGAGLAPAPFAPPRTRWGMRPAVAAALVLCLVGVAWLRLAAPAGWRVTRASGPYTLSGDRLATAPTGRVRLRVGRIGEVDVAPASSLRLLSARPDHRLALDRGAIEARISAPPRLFYVQTPAATAVDLGCAYTLSVDPLGGSLIHVTVGWVELRHGGATSVVPFNMSAYTRPGSAPGTPFADRTADALKAALYRFDFERGGDGALAEVIHSATADDAVTLWHLLSRTSGAARQAVYRRLAELAPPPAGIGEARVVALDRAALRAWWDALPGSPGTLPWWQRAAVRLAAWLGVF